MDRTRPISRLFPIVFGIVVLLAPGVRGADEPASIAIEPGETTLLGRRATAQVLATGIWPDGTLRDLTRSVEWVSLDPAIASVSKQGRVVPSGDGTTTIVARSGSLEARTSVTVKGMGQVIPVSFHNEVVPALSQAGCNMGACHGTPTGKGGLRLSLRGYLPDEDFRTLTRELGMRRVNVIDPDASLLLRKPLGEVPHEGGLRLTRGTKVHEAIREWIHEGANDDPGAPKVERLEIRPGARVLHAPATTQQVSVVAHYKDGTSRDVTPLCYYNSSRPDIAGVDVDSHVTFQAPGEAAVIVHYLDLVGIVRLTHLVEVPGFQVAEVPKDNPIDAAVFAKLNRMRIAPSEPATDADFLRRVYLDVIGVLPTPEESRAFLGDASPEKRAKLIQTLVQRPEFADFWTLKFSDVLRSNSRLIQAKGTHAFQRWVHSNLERNVPMDQLVRELLTADGSTFQNPAANYYRIARDPESAAETTAQLFLGVRIQCAKCHNHLFEKWTQDDYYGFAAFFSRVKQKAGTLPDEEIVFSAGDGEVRQLRTGQVMKPKALGGPVLEPADATGDRREELAKWLTSADNPFFARSLVNRVWYHLMGRGIVDPVDDFRDSNPASNDELLDGLARAFVQNGYDLRKLVSMIAGSRTYQLSAQTNSMNAHDTIYFSHAYTKLLPAEVLLDAISTVTGTLTTFGSLPPGTRAVQIPDGRMENPFLKTFGRPARELACECERETDANLAQALQLIGGSTVHDKLRSDTGRMASLAKDMESNEEITRALYMVAFSREPSASELAAAVKHLDGASDRRQAVEDLGWVLINSKEFLFRH